jgi:hypothetical protein
MQKILSVANDAKTIKGEKYGYRTTFYILRQVIVQAMKFARGVMLNVQKFV